MLQTPQRVKTTSKKQSYIKRINRILGCAITPAFFFAILCEVSAASPRRDDAPVSPRCVSKVADTGRTMIEVRVGLPANFDIPYLNYKGADLPKLSMLRQPGDVSKSVVRYSTGQRATRDNLSGLEDGEYRIVVAQVSSKKINSGTEVMTYFSSRVPVNYFVMSHIAPQIGRFEKYRILADYSSVYHQIVLDTENALPMGENFVGKVEILSVMRMFIFDRHISLIDDYSEEIRGLTISHLHYGVEQLRKLSPELFLEGDPTIQIEHRDPNLRQSKIKWTSDYDLAVAKLKSHIWIPNFSGRIAPSHTLKLLRNLSRRLADKYPSPTQGWHYDVPRVTQMIEQKLKGKTSNDSAELRGIKELLENLNIEGDGPYLVIDAFDSATIGWMNGRIRKILGLSPASVR